MVDLLQFGIEMEPRFEQNTWKNIQNDQFKQKPTPWEKGKNSGHFKYSVAHDISKPDNEYRTPWSIPTRVELLVG